MLKSRAASIVLLPALFGLWYYFSARKTFSADSFPHFLDFVTTTYQEFASGRLLLDLYSSLFRWTTGFFLSGIAGIPLGLYLGKHLFLRNFLSPFLGLFRSLSPLAWIPFAVIWFGIGDAPVIFLIFLGCFFPLLFTTMNAVAQVPKVFDELARDYGYHGQEYFLQILLPAVLPQIVSSLRLVASLAWIVIVPAEMLAGREGLGFAILDARNGLRTDLLVLNMIAVASVAHLIDQGLAKLNYLSVVRWGHEH